MKLEEMLKVLDKEKNFKIFAVTKPMSDIAVFRSGQSPLSYFEIAEHLEDGVRKVSFTTSGLVIFLEALPKKKSP